MVAKGQVSITILKEAYHISQSVGEYIFPALSDGTVASAVTVVSTIEVKQGNNNYTGFTIGSISKPAGFNAITVDNGKKTVTYSVAAHTTTLAEHGSLKVPVLIEGVTYHLSFQWAKAKSGAAGSPGTDANLLDWVNEWNSNKTLIDGSTVITPKLFSGVKNPDGTITGTAIGRFVLSSKDTSGKVTSETVDGIYGFKDGNKTFFVDNGGNAWLGRGDQFIKYDASTGKVGFGAGVSLNWIGATFINKDGIFTGTLSANTVHTLRLDASQITSGTIAAARIDTNALKASLITAGNIEALSLNVTKGKVGSWTIDSDSIYRGTKNNASGGFTGASGSITLGSSGLRGFKWRLDVTGAGAIAGGNIAWDASGNVTFASSVSLNWTNAANAAASQGKLYVRGTGLNHNANRVVQVGSSTVLNTSGRGLNLLVINRSTLAVVSNKTYDVYGNDANCNSLATDMDALGSDKIVILTSYDAIRINATLNSAIQRCGGSDCLITDARMPYALIGIPSIGKNNGLLSVFNVEATAPYAELSTMIINGIPQGVCVDGQRNSYINGNGIYTGSITASQITAGTISADRIAAGSINATKLDASSIKTSIINTGYINGLSCTFVQGTIGGWVIGANALTNTHIALDNGNKRVVVYGANSGVASGQRVQLYYNNDSDFGFYATDASGNCVARLGSGNQIAGWVFNTTQIYKNNVHLGSDGTISNGTKWIFRNDGSGQIASGNILWSAGGTVSFSSSVSLNWINAIDAVQIGGNNLLNNSGEWRGAGWNGGYTSNGGGYTIDNSVTFNGAPTLKTDVGTGLVHSSWLKLETNVEYTYSAMVKCDKSISGNGNTPLHYWSGLNNQNQGKLTVVKSDTSVTANVWKRIYVIFKLTGDGNSFRPFFYRGSNESTFYHIAYFKLEKGNKPTDWSQSVSDANKLSSDAQNTASGVVNALGGSSYPKLTKISSTGIYTGTLTASQISAGTISADRIAANSLNGNKITARTLTADRIVSAAITANEIAARTITAGHIKASAITAYEIAGSTITAAEIASRTITASKIAAGTITANEINVSSIQASVVTASAVNGLSCNFQKGKVGGFTLNDHSLYSTNVTAGHTIGIQSNGYMYNSNSSNNVDYWALNTDGSAMFGTGKIKFNADGSGYVANQNIKWDVAGNVAMNGTITAISGKIAGFTISGNKLINTASDSSIEFSSMIGNASLYINSSTSLISMRADSSRTGISIQTYATGARGISIIANAGSKYAIESYGPIQLGQRAGERWCVPGVLYVGCKYSTGYNNYYRKIWGDGATISSFSHIGDGKYRVYHNLRHTDYTVMAILWSSTGYYGFFRLLERTSSYFVIQNIGSGGKPDAGAFDFVIMGRNAW